MNSFPEHYDPAAEEQASVWAARLEGSPLSAADRVALDEWLADRADHRALLSRYCQFSADLEQQMPLIEGIREMSAGIRTTPATARSFPWLRRPPLAVAALTAAAAVALVFWFNRPALQSEDLATPAAQRQTQTLADGTRIDLNAQTNLRVEIDRQGRHVRLAAGEAFFAVRKDANRPFIVETPAGSVRVTGTQFDVRTEASGLLEVTVLEGSVQAQPNDAAGRHSPPRTLTRGDRLLATPAGVQTRTLSDTELDDALAWRRGQIVFKGEPLHEVLARFARYHGRGITATPEVANLSIGARFSLDDLDGFFEALEAGFPKLKITRNPNGTIQVGQRPGS